MKYKSDSLSEALYQARINEGYKTIAGVRAKVDKDGKIVDEKEKKKIEGRIGKKLNEDVIMEALIGEASEAPKFEDVSDFKVYKKDDKTACVTFGYNGKYYIQGTEDGKEVNLEVADKENLEKCVDYLKNNGFKEETVTKDDMQKQFDKLSEEVIYESLIFEKIGDRKEFSKHEKRVGSPIRRGNQKIAGHSIPNFVSDKENNDANKKLAQKAGGKAHIYRC